MSISRPFCGHQQPLQKHDSWHHEHQPPLLVPLAMILRPEGQHHEHQLSSLITKPESWHHEHQPSLH